MTNIMKTLTLAVFGTLAVAAGHAYAADTTVTCGKPQIEVNTGRDGTQPRMTVHCLGGSSVEGINYFAVQISANPTVAQMVQQTYQSYLEAHKTSSVTLSSNLDDLSGSQWGCAQNNCRVLDYAIGL